SGRGAEEVAVLAPDVLLAAGHSSAAPLMQATRTLPIVFVLVQDAVAAGFVDSLARPGGNATGFTSWEFPMGAKWLELLKQIAPGLTRVAVLRDASQGFAVSQFVAIQTVAPSLGVEAIPVNMRDPGEIEQSVDPFPPVPHCRLIP